MIRALLFLILLAGACFAGIIYSMVSVSSDVITSSDSEVRQLRINFVIENTSSAPRELVTIHAFHPFYSALGQVNKYFNAPSSVESAYQEGDKYISLTVRGMSPYERRSLSLTYGISQSVPTQVAVETGNVHKKIFDIANKLSSDDLVKSVDAWLAGNITPAPFNAKYQGSLATLNKKKGDCTDFAVLAQDLLSARGVSSVLIGGFVIESNSVLTNARAYHNWLWLPDTGRIYDPIKRKIAPDLSEYVAFEFAPNSDSSRFYSDDPNIKVLMK